MWHVWDRREIYTGLWWRSIKEKDQLEDRGVDGSTRLKWILNEAVWIHLV
jgi:hypothetical protein